MFLQSGERKWLHAVWCSKLFSFCLELDGRVVNINHMVTSSNNLIAPSTSLTGFGALWAARGVRIHGRPLSMRHADCLGSKRHLYAMTGRDSGARTGWVCTWRAL